MANVKVSELPAASAASTSQEFEVNDSGTSKKVTGSQIKSFVKDGLVLTDITDVTASITELNYVDGVTSSVQDQLNDKFKQRTITGTTGQITVTNGDGVAGNPTIAAVIASQAEAEAGTDTTKLMTPQRVAQAIDVRAAGQLLASWDYSSNVSSIAFTELSGWRNLSIIFTNVTSSTASSQIRLSTDNGSSYVATGYISAVFDNVGGDAVTNGLAISRGASGTIDGEVKLLNFGTPTLKNHWGILKVATGSRVSVSSGAINLAACNAFQISGGTYSSGKISVYGEGKV